MASSAPAIMQLTLVVALIVLNVVIAFWDVFATYLGHDNATISSIVRDWSKQWPILPLGVGVLIGHLFA